MSSPPREEAASSRIPLCASSTFSCVTDLGHKPVTLYTCQQDENISKQLGGGGGGSGRKRCFWFSRDYGQPIFAMHSNRYLNSECFIIDTEISVLRILPSYQLLLYKDQIHVVEDEDTKVTIEFKNGSDSFAVWIQICKFQDVEPFSTTAITLTSPPNMVPLENHLLRSSSGPTPASSWLTMKFKAPPTSKTQSSTWFTFAKMQLLTINFKKSRYLALLLKSDDPDDDAPPGLFCIRPGITCLKTGSQLYYEPCDGTRRKYILEFDNEPLCEHIWNFARMVTPPDYEFHNEHFFQTDEDSRSEKERKFHEAREIKRNRRLQLIYASFRQLQQEVKNIMKSSKKSLQNIIDMPEIHIYKLFFSYAVWTKRFLNLKGKLGVSQARLSKKQLTTEIQGSLPLQFMNVKLHLDIVKMLMKEGVPAELIAEYREILLKKSEERKQGRVTDCLRIHSLFT